MLSKIFIKQIIMVTTSCVLVACASSGDGYESVADEPRSARYDCISQSTIRDYQVLDDSNLIVTASGKRKYHVVLTRRAMGLRSNWKIGFRSPTGRICAGTGEVLVDDGFGRNERINMKSVRSVSPDEVNDLLVRFGKRVPEFEQAPAKEEIKGAEVEELG